MNQSNQPARIGIVYRILAALALLSFAALALVFAWTVRVRVDGEGKTSGDQSKATASAQIKSSISASALLENNQVIEAIETYRTLVKNNPGRGAAIRNLAVALVAHAKEEAKRVADIVAENGNAPISKKAIQGWETIASEAKVYIDQTISLQPKANAAYQLATELAQAEIDIQPTKQLADQARRKLFLSLSRYLQSVPSNAYMAITLAELSEQLPKTIQGPRGNSVVLDVTKKALQDAFASNPRNYYLLNQLLGTLLSENDLSIESLIQPAIELSKPFRDSNGRNEIVATLEEARQLFATKPDEAMGILAQAQNLMLQTTGLRSDERATKPNTLALIDFSDTQKWIQSEVDTTDSFSNGASSSNSQKQPTFTEYPLGEQADCICWYDWNIDLVPEIVWASEGKLCLGSMKQDSAFELVKLAELEVNKGVQNILPVDLFEVQFADRPQRDFQRRQEEMKSQLSDSQAQRTLDLRHETFRDLVLTGESGIQVVTLADTAAATVPFQWHVVDANTGLEPYRNVTSLKPLDWDADGDLDLAFLADNKVQLLQNRGNRTFESVNEFSDLGPNSWSIASISACDFDRDLDIDILISGHSKDQFAVLENILHGQFLFRELNDQWRALSQSQSLSFGELDGNVSWDWVGSNKQSTQILRTSTTNIGVCIPSVVTTYPWSSNQTVIADLNNDSAPDLLGASDTELFVGWNEANGSMVESKSVIKESLKVSSLSVADLDEDGHLDLAAIVDGKISFWHAISQDKSLDQFVKVRVKGVSDDNGGGRINQYAYGSVVELYSVDRYQAQVINDDTLHFGIGQHESPYNLRIVFTNGLTQNTIKPPVNTFVEEKQLPKGSCPFVYGWDGKNWSLITDLLWNAPLGLQFTKGKPLPDRRWEYIKLPGEFMQPINGRYELRVTEELWEAAYFDQTELFYFDHPIETDVYSNEKVGPASMAEPSLWQVAKPIEIARITDQRGRDWTKELGQRDNLFAVPFTEFRCQGNVEPHWLQLDLNSISDIESKQLYLTGWIYPTDTSLNIAMDQNTEVPHPEPPSLWSLNDSGQFECVRPFMGFPGGKPKTIVIELNGAFLSADRQIQIRCSNEIYYDQIFIADGKRLSMPSEPLVLDTANLAYRGFSNEVNRGRPYPHWYDYQTPHIEPNWPPMAGEFTRYGDVLSLVKDDDDRMVVMSSGDEMVLNFKVPSTPVPEGYRRDFILHSVGWDKDADLNTLEGQSSLPLPFAAMRQYPPPADQSEQAEKVMKLNAPSLNRTQSYRDFWRH